MSLDPGVKALQLVFPGFTIGVDDPADAERLTALGVGGFCLYGGAPAEIASLIGRLQRRARVPLLFCADYEDGTASHVAGGTELSTNMALGAAGREDLARLKGRLTAVEARAMGVRWVFAPVLDLANRPENPIVNVRSFGADPDLVGRLGKALCEGLREGGALSCLKHFPGHGDTREDSHLALPLLDVSLERLRSRELVPFRAAASADSVMLAHLAIPALGGPEGAVASLAREALELLRREVPFDRLAVTDALSMNAVSGSLSDAEASAAALEAGADILLVPARPLDLCEALPRLLDSKPGLLPAVEAAWRRLAAAKASAGLEADRGIPREQDLSLVGCGAHREAAEAMASASLAWVRRGPGGSWKGARPKEVLYLEPDADRPDEWQGAEFVSELGRLGLAVRPWAGDPPAPGAAAVAGSFLRPRAYSGRIRHSERERARLEGAFARAGGGTLVSFGSPFVFDETSGWTAGLCAFGGSGAAQAAAARALAGEPEVRGAMPVPLQAARGA